MKPKRTYSRANTEAILRKLNAVDEMPQRRGDVAYIECVRRDDPDKHPQIARVACLGAFFVIDVPWLPLVEGGEA
jgi:hypothetical protein